MKKTKTKIILSVFLSILVTFTLLKIFLSPYTQDIYLSKSQDGIQIEERHDLQVPLNAPAIIKHPEGWYFYSAFSISPDEMVEFESARNKENGEK